LGAHSECLDAAHVPIHLLLGDGKGSAKSLESGVTHHVVAGVKRSLELSLNTLNLLDSIGSCSGSILNRCKYDLT
jgi:hypothetical protein